MLKNIKRNISQCLTGTPFALGNRKYYPLIFFIVSLLLVGVICKYLAVPKLIDYLFPAIAVAAGLTYFLYNQHLQQTRLFIELFREFNKKYDSLNDKLNQIAKNKDSILQSTENQQILFDYFNLCSEEYLYFKTGFIDPEVWLSWKKGMRYYSKIPHIRKIWEIELLSGSYYGFTLSDLDSDDS